jgi:NAD dependent epimerase/dehydratase family enzyme
MRKHRRGLFAAINVGLGYGKGQRAPTWMDNKGYTPMVNRLLAHKDINRLANFASCERSLLLQFLLADLS